MEDVFWWARRDSNPHGLLHMLLRHACMPISPLARIPKKHYTENVPSAICHHIH